MTLALIAEDEPLLAQELHEELARLWPELEVGAVVHDGHAALREFERLRPRLLFLDVQMPGLDGLELARLVAGRAHLVFITAFAHYAVQAFDEGAVDYLLKPLDRVRLARALLRAKERLNQPPADLRPVVDALAQARAAAPSAAAAEPLRWISVQRGRELKLITVDEVCYFRADSKYVAVVTADSEALISTPLKELLPRLDPQVFWQVHRSTVVNAHAIDSVQRSSIGGGLTLVLKHRPERLQVSATFASRFRHM
jgi:DNA-binding LytR/AlgR family response regulator